MKKTKKSGVGKFVLGASIGAALGVLFAPKSGRETRREIKLKAGDLLDKAKELDAVEVKDAIEDKVMDIIDELKDLDKEKAILIAKKKAKELKKHAEELANYAKEKATPVVEEAADALREKAIEATKKILDKLETEK